MIGAMIGDVIGSIYEFDNIKKKDFPLISPKCNYTDDTLMTLAVADALLAMDEKRDFKKTLVTAMQTIAKDHPCPMGDTEKSFMGGFRRKMPNLMIASAMGPPCAFLLVGSMPKPWSRHCSLQRNRRRYRITTRKASKVRKPPRQPYGWPGTGRQNRK